MPTPLRGNGMPPLVDCGCELMTPPSSLAIVGASTRAAAASAIRAGFQPIAADLFADADLRQFATSTRIAPYPDGFLDWLRAVLPPMWMYTGALENHPELVDLMAWVAPLWGNGGDVLEQVRSPWALAEALRSAGLLFPEMRASDDGLPRDDTWLAKTYRGASGSGVRAWGEEPPRGYPARSEQRGTRGEEPVGGSMPVCFQRRIDGTPCAAVFVAVNGYAELLGVTRQLIGEDWLGAHGFQYAGSIGPWPVSSAAHRTIRQVGHVLAEQFDLLGLFGVDMIINRDEVWVLEVNPRYTASVEIVERATGVYAIAAHAAACRGMPIAEQRSTLPAPRLHGKAILFAKRGCEITEPFGEATLAEALQSPWPNLADVSPPGTLIEVGRPILTLFADGSSVEEVEQRLRDRALKLERQVNGR